MLLKIEAKYYELRFRILWCIIKMWLTYVRNLNVRKVFFSNQQGPMAFPSRNSYHKPLVIFCEALKLPSIPQSHPLPQNAQLPELQCKTRKKFPKTAHSHAKMAHFHTHTHTHTKRMVRKSGKAVEKWALVSGSNCYWPCANWPASSC